MLAAATTARAAHPVVYLFGTVSGTSGFGPAGSQCTFESQGTSSIAFNISATGTILMTGMFIDRQDQQDLIHSTYYGVASFTPTSPVITFEGFRSIKGGLPYPIYLHDYYQNTDSAGIVHIGMRLKLDECLMVVKATYHPLGSAPIFP